VDFETWNLIWAFSPNATRRFSPKDGILQPEAIDELWKIHKEIHQKRIGCLHGDSVKELSKTLSGNGLFENETLLIAGHIACEYLHSIEKNSNAPRPSKIWNELDNIRSASIALERALKNSSKETIRALEDYIDTEGNPDYVELPTYEIFFGETWKEVSGQEIREVFFNPPFLFSLSDIAIAARECQKEIPKDSGSAVAGNHDSTGARVRTRLALTARVLLRQLGLPSGSQKGGPVSEFLYMIHKSATGEPPAWADRYAEMSPKLEKNRQEAIAKWEAERELTLEDSMGRFIADGGLENVRRRWGKHGERKKKYFAELAKSNETP